jgi:hypothetical protein
MFTWTKQGGERPRFRFFWWPLVLSIALTIALNLLIR